VETGSNLAESSTEGYGNDDEKDNLTPCVWTPDVTIKDSELNASNMIRFEKSQESHNNPHFLDLGTSWR
jgi:hypothetical protein